MFCLSFWWVYNAEEANERKHYWPPCKICSTGSVFKRFEKGATHSARGKKKIEKNRKEIHETDNCHLCLISLSRPASRFGFQKVLLENKWQSPQEKEEGSQFFTGFYCTNPCKKEVRKLLPGNQPHLNGAKIQISPDKFVGEWLK